jgi:hypothetical protein
MSAILAFETILIARRAYEHMRDRLSWVLWAMLLLLLPALALMIGGISFAIEAGGGLYWVFAGVLAGFACGSANAWVLLVEIQR